ncbi:MAG: hypothetical protein MI724_19600, partial [Spirochaetales bacterium]|nr:hypothetical protein [Spirochaetales bacterium]
MRINYFSFLRSVLVLVLSLLTLFSLLDYLEFRRKEVSRILENERYSLAQVDSFLTTMAAETLRISQQIWHDTLTNSLLFSEAMSDPERMTSLNQFRLYLSNSLFINSVYIYNSRQNTYFLATEAGLWASYGAAQFPDRAVLRLSRDGARFASALPVYRRFDYRDEHGVYVDDEVLTYFFDHAGGVGGRGRSHLIVNVDLEKIRSIIDSPHASTFLVLDLLDTAVSLYENPVPRSVIERLSDSGERIASGPSPYIRFVHDEKEMIAIARSALSGAARLVRGYREAELFTNLARQRIRRFLVYLSLLLLSLVLSVVSVLRLFRPVQRMVFELDTLKKSYEHDFSLIHNAHLLNLLHHSKDMSPESLRTALEESRLLTDGDES